MHIGHYVQGRNNNYNLIRHLAASAVLFTHSYGLLGRGAEEPMLALTGQSFSYVAVNLFFVLSGFLITASWINRGRSADFLAARIMRIAPALWMSVGLCMFIVGPLFTVLSLGDYFLHRDFYIFGAENSTLLINGVYHYLPGVFEDLPHPRFVNESLWTLPYELKMYIAVWLLGLTALLRFPAVVIVLYALLLPAHLAISWFNLLDVGDPGLIRLASYFAAGATYYLLREYIPLRGTVAAGLVLAVIVAYLVAKNIGAAVLTLTLPYLVFAFAYLAAGRIRGFNRLGDYSYGIYIYAFPIQQMLVSMGIRDLSVHIILSYVVTLMIAVISWHFLEAPALKRRHWLSSRLQQMLDYVRRRVASGSP